MRLVDLAPRWITFPTAADGVKFYYGLSFLCPHCDHTDCPTCGSKRGKRVAVSFWPPIDPDGWLERMAPFPHENFHTRTSGETFETLTLTPSIRMAGHWHGSIANGAILPA